MYGTRGRVVSGSDRHVARVTRCQSVERIAHAVLPVGRARACNSMSLSFSWCGWHHILVTLCCHSGRVRRGARSTGHADGALDGLGHEAGARGGCGGPAPHSCYVLSRGLLCSSPPSACAHSPPRGSCLRRVAGCWRQGHDLRVCSSRAIDRSQREKGCQACESITTGRHRRTLAGARINAAGELRVHGALLESTVGQIPRYRASCVCGRHAGSRSADDSASFGFRAQKQRIESGPLSVCAVETQLRFTGVWHVAPLSHDSFRDPNGDRMYLLGKYAEL